VRPVNDGGARWQRRRVAIEYAAMAKSTRKASRPTKQSPAKRAARAPEAPAQAEAGGDDDAPLVCMITCAKQEAAQVIARALVQERLAACVNLIPGVRSIYTWEGAVCDDDEVLCLVKTTVGRFAAMRDRVLRLHTYATPEIIGLPITHAHGPYLDWLRASIKPAQTVA